MWFLFYGFVFIINVLLLIWLLGLYSYGLYVFIVIVCCCAVHVCFKFLIVFMCLYCLFFLVFIGFVYWFCLYGFIRFLLVFTVVKFHNISILICVAIVFLSDCFYEFWYMGLCELVLFFCYVLRVVCFYIDMICGKTL